MKSFLITFFILNTLYLILNTSPVAAQGYDLSLTPQIVEFTATPSSTVKATLTLSNHTDNTQTVSPLFKAFTALRDDGSPVFDDDSTSTIESWVRLEKEDTAIGENFTLRPLETAELILNLNIPKEATAGDYYASVIFVNTTDTEKEAIDPFTAATKIAAGIGSNILVSVVDPRKAAATDINLKSFTATPGISFGQALRVSAVLENKAIHRADVEGTIEITDAQGRVLETITLPQKTILSQSLRTIANSTWQPNLLGKYQATVSIKVDETHTLKQTQTFYFLPWDQLIKIGAFVLIVVIIISRVQNYVQNKRKGRRNRKNR